MKSTTLAAICSAVAGVLTVFLLETFATNLSDTLLSTIILTIVTLIMWIPPLFITVIDNRKPYFKEHPMIGHVLTLIIFIPFILFSLYVMISNHSINQGIFNLAMTIYAFGAVVWEVYKMLKKSH